MFDVPLHAANVEPLIMFHISLPMGYVDSYNYYCCTSETFVNLSNAIWENFPRADPYLFHDIADSSSISPVWHTGNPEPLYCHSFLLDYSFFFFLFSFFFFILQVNLREGSIGSYRGCRPLRQRLVLGAASS